MSADSPAWHIVTCEYPPQVGGVSDYGLAIASGLAASGCPVHVWCPDTPGPATDTPRVVVHRDFGRFGLGDLKRVGRGLNAQPGPRRLFVQWVPHGYGFRSLNLAFAAWLGLRAWRRRDEVHLMIHEPFLVFSARPLAFAVALVHRLMLAVACSGAAAIWVSIPRWEADIRPFVPVRVPVRWLPIPAPRLRDATPAEIDKVRRRIAPAGQSIVGHFGTFSPLVARLLEPALDAVLQGSDAAVLLVGRDGDRFRDAFLQRRPEATHRVHATGVVDCDALCAHLQACDLMVQPYPDGISSRRTSALALMAHRIPVVTNSGDLTEAFWRETGAVALVAGPDGPRIGQAALGLLADTAARHRLASDALDMYDRMFDVRHAVGALEAAS